MLQGFAKTCLGNNNLKKSVFSRGSWCSQTKKMSLLLVAVVEKTETEHFHVNVIVLNVIKIGE